MRRRRGRRGGGGGRQGGRRGRRGGRGGAPRPVVLEIPEGAVAERSVEALPEVEYLDRLTPARTEQLRAFCAEHGIEIRDLNLLNRALSHKSYTNEIGLPHNEQNEKLEFFGDGVLGLVVNEHLFRRFPDVQEGHLAKTKSQVVSEATLAGIARKIRLERLVLLGRGEEASGGRYRAGLLADCLEAVIGAVYLDAGLETARRFVLRFMEEEVERATSAEGMSDFKSLLQEYVQRTLRTRPTYRVVRAIGPEHSKEFRIEVSAAGRRAAGQGRSKKEAEQAAAEALYRRLVRETEERGHRAEARHRETPPPAESPVGEEAAGEETPVEAASAAWEEEEGGEVPSAVGEAEAGPASAPVEEPIAEEGERPGRRRRRGRRGGRRRGRRGGRGRRRGGGGGEG